jgi:hypothetical protein
MSRTIRRKNAWNKKDFVEHEDSWLQHMSGENPFPYISWRRNKFKGCSHVQIKKKLSAKFHSDSFYNTSMRGVKKESAWQIRNEHKMELINAIKNGDEENLFNDYEHKARRINGWWWNWD